ncbi:hypothetical protein HZS_6824, partial [Henneguya salminicola]
MMSCRDPNFIVTELMRNIDFYSDVINMQCMKKMEINNAFITYKNEISLDLKSKEMDKKMLKKLKMFYSMLYDLKEMVASYDQQTNQIYQDHESIKKLICKILNLHQPENAEENVPISEKARFRIDEYNAILNTVRINLEYRYIGLKRSKQFILFLAKKINKSFEKNSKILQNFNSEIIDKFIDFSFTLYKIDKDLGFIHKRMEILKEKSWKCLNFINQLNCSTPDLNENELIQLLQFDINNIKINSNLDNDTFIFEGKINLDPITVFRDEEAFDYFIYLNNLEDCVTKIKKWLYFKKNKIKFKTQKKIISSLEI